jgi:hypothetical protein
LKSEAKRLKKRSKKRKKSLLITGIVLFLVALLALNLYIWYNVWLRGLFDQDFFDFSMFKVPENDANDLESIIAKYAPVFEKLEESAIERLEELYQAAAAEYQEESQAGTLNRFQLANKYLQAGRLLESSVDNAFYTLLDGMEKELKKNDLPTAIVSEIESAYEETKKDKKEELFGRLRGHLDY